MLNKSINTFKTVQRYNNKILFLYYNITIKIIYKNNFMIKSSNKIYFSLLLNFLLN